jgi:OmpA-OmpF porin, OOP family
MEIVMNVIKKGLAAAILALAGTNAMASGYVGVGFGTVDPDLDAISDFEDSSGLEIIGGFNINPNMAFELSYVDLGESSDTMVPVWTVSASGIAGALLLKAQAGESAEVFFKFGLFNWDASISEQGFGEFVSDSGTDFFFGFGAAFKLNQTVSLGMRYNAYSMDDQDPTMLSANIQIGF